MLHTIYKTVSWGTYSALSSTLFCIIFGFEKKSKRNIVIMSTILGCIRGYTGKNIIALCLSYY